MSEEMLLDRWNAQADEKIADFLRALNPELAGADIIKNVMWGDSDTESEEQAYLKRFEAIKAHPLFAILKKNYNFIEFYQWLEGQNEYTHLVPTKGKSLLLQAMLISYAAYARRKAGRRIDANPEEVRLKIKKLQKQSQTLLKTIETFPELVDSPASLTAFENAKKYLEFLSKYQTSKSQHKTEIIIERHFIHDLTQWFLWRGLPLKYALIRRIEDALEIDYEFDQSHLDRTVKACEHLIKLDQERLKQTF